MTRRSSYDRGYQPPAPVALLRVVHPGGDAGVVAQGLIDTGADCTLVPESLARVLDLPCVGRLEVLGVGGGGGSAPAYAARVEIAGNAILTRLVAYEEDVIIGRDVLNRLLLVLHGPRQRVRVTSPKPR